MSAVIDDHIVHIRAVVTVENLAFIRISAKTTTTTCNAKNSFLCVVGNLVTDIPIEVYMTSVII